jgi:hypothetical protein
MRSWKAPLHILGVNVELTVENPRIREYVALMYGAYLCEASKPDRKFIVSEGLSLTADCEDLGCVAGATNPAALIDTLFLRWIGAIVAPLTLLHAAAIVHQGKCHLVLGNSGIGKTSLALGLAHKGADILADDIVVLDGACQAIGLQRPIHVRSSGSMIPPEYVPLGEGKYGRGRTHQHYRPVSTLIVLSDELSEEGPLAPKDLLSILAQFVMAEPSDIGRAFELLCAMANSVRAFRLPRGTSPDETLERALSLLCRS